MPFSAFLDLDWATIRTYERELSPTSDDDVDWDAATETGTANLAWNTIAEG